MDKQANRVEIVEIDINDQRIENKGNDYFFNVYDLIVGYFEYETITDKWIVTEKAKTLLRFETICESTDGQGNISFYENEPLNELIDAFMISEEHSLTQEILIRHKHEPWETLVIKCLKKTNEFNQIVISGILVDVSDKQKQDIIDSQLEKLQALGQLTSGVSHDFNNQLNGILGYVALMKTMTDDKTLLRYMDGIERSVRHSTELTRQLLAFSHKSDNKRNNLDLQDILKDVVSMLEHTFDRRITIESQVNSNEFYILGDSSQLHNAILNLCINARDAINGQGRIRLTLEKEQIDEIKNNLISTHITPNEYAVLKVIDTGCGIDPKLRNKIFKPFFTTKDVGKGTGIGLAAVADTIKSHNGAITIDSVIGKGTTFTLYLPMNHGIEEVLDEVDIYCGVGKILLIDDEMCNLEISHALLESFGYEVVSFSNPKKAIEYYAQNPEEFNCVLLDVIMPYMSGAEVFEALKLINPDSKVILLTGVSERQELDFILRHGVDAYVPKPVDKYTLSNGVYTVLNPKPFSTKPVSVEKLVELDTSLNVSMALESIASNVRLYMKIAHSFRKQFYMTGEYLPQLIDSNLKEAIRMVHTIKGLAGQLGADDLYEYGRELETALTQSKPCEHSLKIFLEEFVDVMDELAKIEQLGKLSPRSYIK
ncbi:MAG: ATP-binding protein [Turicibacter sp.]